MPLGTIDIDAIGSESSTLEFKARFDVTSKQDWCELIKDLVAMANSGGGVILVGVADDGTLSGWNADALLAVDAADVTNRIHSYTDQHFADFAIEEACCAECRLALIRVGFVRIPIVFTAHGGYGVAGGGQKSAFVKGSVYFRHGAKSEPGTSDDLRMAIERELEHVKSFWLDGIGKIMTAPAGATVQISAQSLELRDSPDSAPVRWTSDGDAPRVSVENVSLRDEPSAVAIRLTTDEGAPTLSVFQADKLYPHRQKELLKRLAERIEGGPTITAHDLQCVRRVHGVDGNPTFSYAAQHSPRKYTETFVEWLVQQHRADPTFFQKAREAVRPQAK